MVCFSSIIIFVLCSCEKPQKELFCFVYVFFFMKRLLSLDLKANFVGKRLVPLCANTPKKKKKTKEKALKHTSTF